MGYQDLLSLLEDKCYFLSPLCPSAHIHFWQGGEGLFYFGITITFSPSISEVVTLLDHFDYKKRPLFCEGAWLRPHGIQRAMASSVFKPGLFKHKVAIVTGGGSGIGKAISAELLELGTQLCFHHSIIFIRS